MKRVVLEWTYPQYIFATNISYVLALIGEDINAQDWIYSHYVNMHVFDINGMYLNPGEYFNSNGVHIAVGDSWGGVPLLRYEITRKHLINLSVDSLFDYIYEALLQKNTFLLLLILRDSCMNLIIFIIFLSMV
jgi:hypothetical protein